MTRKICLVCLLLLAAYSFHPPAAHAGFFLFNIIRDVLGGHPSASPSPAKPSPAAAKPPAALKLGMRGQEVAQLQQYLINSKYLGGKPDGIFGRQTQLALRQFQQDRGLSPDGIAGAKTLAVLRSFKGTKPAGRPQPSPSSPGGIPPYLYAESMIVTAYTRYDEGCTDYTYRGTYLRRGLCAVDPAVIPLGTRLYIPGYGEALADDIGGAIIGKHVDLAMDSLDEAFTWGKQTITVYVLK